MAALRPDGGDVVFLPHPASRAVPGEIQDLFPVSYRRRITAQVKD